ncbi:MAG: hypothetical protein ACREB7_08430 [Sphingopyxis sp.]|uniref:hypothetical protein n=1 Tax=Sphingopyxis sp. TaxID=1908224 RepID=UPI003D6C99DB
MANPSLSSANARLYEALEAVYEQFAAPKPPVIEGCPCCIDSRNVDILLATPLRDIKGEDLWRYVSGAFYTIGSARDFRYLLPRILEVSVGDPGNANDPEIVLNKLRLADWQTWSIGEKEAVGVFLDAWFERALVKDLLEAEAGWISSETESVICGATLAGFPINHWLIRLTEPVAAPILEDLKARYPNQLSPFWEESPAGLKAFSVILASGRA